MNKIPQKLKDDMSSDPFYQKCCLEWIGGCGGVNIYGRSIEWHHALIFAGSQVQEKFCILPACINHHRLADRSDIKEMFNLVLLNRGSDEELRRYSKLTDYISERSRLNKKHVTWK